MENITNDYITHELGIWVFTDENNKEYKFEYLNDETIGKIDNISYVNDYGIIYNVKVSITVPMLPKGFNIYEIGKFFKSAYRWGSLTVVHNEYVVGKNEDFINIEYVDFEMKLHNNGIQDSYTLYFIMEKENLFEKEKGEN